MANVTVDLKHLEEVVSAHIEDSEHDRGIDIAFGALVGIAEQADALQTNLAHLLKQIGEPALCKACGAEIWFVVNRNGKRAPYTKAGLNHFADCPAAEKFRKGKA